MKKRKSVRKILQESRHDMMVNWTENCGISDVKEVKSQSV